MKPKPKPKRGPGRPLHDPAGGKKPVTVWVSPSERRHLERLAGSAPAGLRLLLAASLSARS